MKILLFLLVITAGTGFRSLAQQVVLLRHAEVALDHPGWMSSKKANNFRRAYNTAPVHQFDPDTVLAKLPLRITDTVYVSKLPRSIATGLKLYGDSAHIVSLGLLNEFEMHMIWLPLCLPYKGWTILSRSMWLLGLEKPGAETYGEARQRVKIVADLIESKVEIQEQVILVTHGFINRNIAKELKKRGWRITQNNGKDNLGATVLVK